MCIIFHRFFFVSFQTGNIEFDKIDVSQKSLKDYFMTDPISRSSLTMAKCIQAVKKQESNPYR